MGFTGRRGDDAAFRRTATEIITDERRKNHRLLAAELDRPRLRLVYGKRYQLAVRHRGKLLGELGSVAEERPREGRHVRAQFCVASGPGMGIRQRVGLREQQLVALTRPPLPFVTAWVRSSRCPRHVKRRTVVKQWQHAAKGRYGAQ